MASSQIAYAGGDVVVTVNAIDSTGAHVAVTGINASRLSINGSASAVVPSVANPDTGIYVLTWTSLSLSEGDSIVALIDGSVAGTAFSTYGIPVKVLAPQRGTDNASTFNASSDTVVVGTNNDKTGYSISGSKTTLDALNDFDQSTQTVDIGKINGNATSASNLQKSTSQIIQGTVSSSPVPTNNLGTEESTFGSSSFSSSIPDDAYIGRLIVFTSGTLSGQTTNIKDYAYDSGNSVGFFTTKNLTSVPQANDTFIIV